MSEVKLSEKEITINAPMPGMVISYSIKEGDKVKAGDVVLILEAMKMENNITSPVDGVLKKIIKEAGASVEKGEVLCIIEKTQ